MELQDLASRTGTSSAMLLKGGSAAGPDADDEDMYRPQKSNFIVLWFRQYGVLLKNNFTLTFLRYYRSTILQIIAPFFFMLFLYILQKAAESSDVVPNAHPTPYPLGGITPCKGNGASQICINAMFSPPNDTDATAIMTILARLNNARAGTNFAIEAPLDTFTVPTEQLGFVPVPSENFIYAYTIAQPNVTQYGVTFTRTGNTFAYTLWYNSSQTANTTQDVSEIYSLDLFSFVRGLDEAIATYVAGTDITFNITMKDWPIIPAPGESVAIIQQAGPVFFFGCAMVNFLMVLNAIVGEKEYKLRHGMQMMGLKTSVYWLSWFTVNMVIVLFSSLLEVAFGIAFQFNVFTNASFAALFLLFFIFGLSMITFAFFITTLVRKVKAADIRRSDGRPDRGGGHRRQGGRREPRAGGGAAIAHEAPFIMRLRRCCPFRVRRSFFARSALAVGMLVLVLGLVFQIAIFSSTFTTYIWWSDTTNPAGWIVLSFIPFFNFGKVYTDIALSAAGSGGRRIPPPGPVSYNYASGLVTPGPGFSWDDLFVPIPPSVRPSGSYTFPPPVQGMEFMVMNLFFYAFLTWYLDAVIPDEYGQRLPPWFFLTPSYWGIKCVVCRRRTDDPAGNYSGPAKEADEDEDVYSEREAALDGERSGDAAIRLVNLRKVYNDGPCTRAANRKVAVSSSSWTLREGRLLALLGQNGAGKSTTMNMLCGFTRPSSGNAFMYGLSIRNDMTELRDMMGVCPQHDILFADLTALEHIELFCGIKNIPAETIPRLARERLEAVRLWKVKDRVAGTYSGGMKRRLSVAISTIGNPKIVFMDEPTTGMDPLNRRHVWAFIEKFKRNRVIVLTTHSMEEADILGDQIAIMALGKLRALGAPIRLKTKFGAGYRVSLVCNDADTEEVKADIVPRVPENARTPDMKLEDDSAGALIFQVPQASLHLLPGLVKYLDAGGNGKVREWGISQTTLEEVFLLLIRAVNPTATIAALKTDVAVE